MELVGKEVAFKNLTIFSFQLAFALTHALAGLLLLIPFLMPLSGVFGCVSAVKAVFFHFNNRTLLNFSIGFKRINARVESILLLWQNLVLMPNHFE